jgi:hypothetical protein
MKRRDFLVKSAVMTLRSSSATGSGAARGVPHARQNLATAGFSVPQAVQTGTATECTDRVGALPQCTCYGPRTERWERSTAELCTEAVVRTSVLDGDVVPAVRDAGR